MSLSHSLSPMSPHREGKAIVCIANSSAVVSGICWHIKGCCAKPPRLSSLSQPLTLYAEWT